MAVDGAASIRVAVAERARRPVARGLDGRPRGAVRAEEDHHRGGATTREVHVELGRAALVGVAVDAQPTDLGVRHQQVRDLAQHGNDSGRISSRAVSKRMRCEISMRSSRTSAAATGASSGQPSGPSKWLRDSRLKGHWSAVSGMPVFVVVAVGAAVGVFVLVVVFGGAHAVGATLSGTPSLSRSGTTGGGAGVGSGMRSVSATPTERNRACCGFWSSGGCVTCT